MKREFREKCSVCFEVEIALDAGGGGGGGALYLSYRQREFERFHGPAI